MVIEEPRSARREATRTRVLDAARIVFAEKGVIGATIEDICEQAGFTRGAVYSNFADKDAIVLEVMEREHQVLLDHITGSIELVEAELASAGSLEAAVSSLVNRIVRTIPLDRQVTLIATELEIMAVRRPDLSASFLAVNNAFRERLAAFLVAAMARVGREPVVDPLDIIDAVKAIGERSVRRALIEGPDADADALSEAVLPTVILALSRPVVAPAAG
jgi:AcrR family transcriptional regulator